MSEMVERVARAIDPEAWGLQGYEIGTIEAVRLRIRRAQSLHSARAYIAEKHRLMIDAALAEDGEQG